jgi:hypothetical protein
MGVGTRCSDSGEKERLNQVVVLGLIRSGVEVTGKGHWTLRIRRESASGSSAVQRLGLTARARECAISDPKLPIE